MDGSKSAKEAFSDFVDSILAGIARIVAQKLTESLFGSMGQSGGGLFGGSSDSGLGLARRASPSFWTLRAAST